jgi:hypothetical protein
LRWGALDRVASTRASSSTKQLDSTRRLAREVVGAACRARRRKTAAPRLLRTLSGAANPGLGAGVRTIQDARTVIPAETNLTARRPAPRNASRSARHDTECRRAGLHHGEVVAKARWGAHSHAAHTRSTARNHHSSLATEARHPPGTWLGGAPRGGPRSSQRQTQHEGAFTSTADAAYLGWKRRGDASRGTRVVTRSWGNGDPPTLGGSKARAQASPREGNGAREEETTVLTAGRRCSRCRLEVDGGVA